MIKIIGIIGLVVVLVFFALFVYALCKASSEADDELNDMFLKKEGEDDIE